MTMDAGEIALIRKTFESALLESGDDAVGMLEELGWWELHAAEPVVAVTELFEAQGRLRRSTSALDVVVAGALGEAPAARTAVVHPALGAWDRPPGRGGGADVNWSGVVVAGLERAERLIIPVDDRGHLAVATVEATAVDARAVAGIDPLARLVAITGAAPRECCREVPETATWVQVSLAARLALAQELCGLTQALLDEATVYVTDRHQFGRPIAAFQTVRHRLTEVFVALASARAAVDAGWATGEPLIGDAAKALAGRAGLLAARHCLQVTGAIGFTEEYGLADRIRRVHLLDSLYGGADSLQAAIGSRLLVDGSVPRFHPLPS